MLCPRVYLAIIWGLGPPYKVVIPVEYARVHRVCLLSSEERSKETPQLALGPQAFGLLLVLIILTAAALPLTGGNPPDPRGHHTT